MKKWIALFFSLVIVLSLCACRNEDSSNISDSEQGKDELTDFADSSNVSNSEQEKDELTDDEIEFLVVNALYKEIDSKYQTADAGSCRYSINKTEEMNGFTYVYGSVTLYNKYGKTTSGWFDESGTPFRSFTVRISNGSHTSSCEIE